MPKKIQKTILYLTVFLILAKVILLTGFFLSPAVAIPSEDITIKTQDLIDMTNNYRKDLGLKELTYNPRLTQAAVNKARDLLSGQYFNHTSPDGKRFSEWIREVNYDYFYVGENLAIDFDNTENAFQAWLDSETHKDNIVKPEYQEIGMAVLEGKYQSHKTIIVVQLFGSRVMGTTEGQFTTRDPISDLVDNYFYQQTWWEKLTSLESIERLNIYNNYLLMIFIGLVLITHRRQLAISQRSIKTPIINRYQANIDKE